MCDERKSVIDLFKKADFLISQRPELMEKTVDELVDYLDDGSEEMKDIRWGIITRVAMRELSSHDYCSIIDFLKTYKRHTLECRYIGFILQEEFQIDLLELIIEAQKVQQLQAIYPFVKAWIGDGECSHIEEINLIESILKEFSDSVNQRAFLDSVVKIIVKNKEEDILFSLFKTNYSEEKELLTRRIIYILAEKGKTEKIEKWIKELLEESKYCYKKVGIFCLNVIYPDNSVFEDNIDIVRKCFKIEDLSIELVPVCVNYLKNGNQYNSEVLDWIKINLHADNIEYIDAIGKSIQFIRKPNVFIEKIVTQLISIAVSSDNHIWNYLDYLLPQIYENSSKELFSVLFSAYKTTTNKESFQTWKDFDNTCSFLKRNEDEIIDLWTEYALGNSKEFLFALLCIKHVISVSCIVKNTKRFSWSDDTIIDFLKGCLLFLNDEKILLLFVFELVEMVTEVDRYYCFCKDYIYSNYPGASVARAKEVKSVDNEKKRELANAIIKYNEIVLNRIQKGSLINEIKPPLSRTETYYRTMHKKQQHIQDQAQKESVFFNLLHPQKIKYGIRFAFIQKTRDGNVYQTREYQKIAIEKELPKKYLNDPMDYSYEQCIFLEKRDNNEVNT